MTSEAPTPQTSTAGADAQRSDSELVAIIRGAGWWQGAVIEDAALRTLGLAMPNGATHWVMASQTCNIYNPSFGVVRMVEWVGANALADDAYRPELANGSHPRSLHCFAKTSDAGEQLRLNCDIQLRHWMDRKVLADLAPLKLMIRDDPESKQKDSLIGWLARSYTRLELSNELGDAIRESSLENYLASVIRNFEPLLLGIFLLAEDDNDTSPTLMKPSASNKCRLQITFVARDREAQEKMNSFVADQLTAKVGNPTFGRLPDQPKSISRKTKAALWGLQVDAIAVEGDEWKITDINRTIRYTFSDHLSDSSAAA